MLALVLAQAGKWRILKLLYLIRGQVPTNSGIGGKDDGARDSPMGPDTEHGTCLRLANEHGYNESSD